MIIPILQYAVAVATIITGLVSLLWPLKVLGFTGLQVSGGRGVTEIRAVLGAFFIGLGASALYFNAPETYAMLGITYLVVALVRAISMLVDRSIVSSNTLSLVVELIFGVILVL
ncbi:MAG: DUF4345 family protein [Anaerolineales bacterium]